MRQSIIVASLVSSLLAALGWGSSSAKAYEQADVYKTLRQQVLALDPSEIGLADDGSSPVFGMLMETGYPEAVASLVTLADGTVSLYFSTGGGIVGAGEHDGPRRAGAEFLALAPQFLGEATATEDFPLPRQGNTRFYFLTHKGVFTAGAPEEALGNNRLPLSPLFHQAHEVIRQARLAKE